MKIYRFWARASAPVATWKNDAPVHAYGGSNASIDDALRHAEERARAAASAIERGDVPGHYGYGDRPVREEIVEEITDGGERRVAVITRNAYGCLVLNAADALFADVDYGAPPPGGLLARLLGRTAPGRDEEIVGRVEAAVHAAPGLGVRLYRTAAGFRALVVSRTYEPASDEARGLMESLDSDPLYMKLCSVQECFRARLTAKPWRCGAERPPSRFPWASAEAEQRYRAWERAYDDHVASFATCALIGTFGNETAHPSVLPILEIHDRFACSEGLPIA